MSESHCSVSSAVLSASRVTVSALLTSARGSFLNFIMLSIGSGFMKMYATTASTTRVNIYLNIFEIITLSLRDLPWFVVLFYGLYRLEYRVVDRVDAHGEGVVVERCIATYVRL